MREFFGLIIFIILLCIWSFVFADADAEAYSSGIASNYEITVEKNMR